MKVLTLVGTRPEIIKLSCVLPKLDEYFEHILVHSGQNYDYELNQIFFDDLGIRTPDIFLEAAGKTPAETIANTIHKFDEVLEKEKPEAIILYGDTNSCLGIISAKRRKIPIFHLEAGNRCFDQRVPEEINRKIVDHLSDINFVHSEHARRYLLREGLPAEQIIKSGSPMREIFKNFKNKIESSKILEELSLKEKNYFVVSIHREENVDSDENFQSLLDSLTVIQEKYKKRVIVSTHPRTRKKLESTGVKLPNIEFMKPLSFSSYVKLQKNSFCVLSDSGTITEESSLLDFPAIMIRQAHERPEGTDAGCLIMSGVNKDRIIESVDMTVSINNSGMEIEDYKNENFSNQVVKSILSYTDYINQRVWKKKI